MWSWLERLFGGPRKPGGSERDAIASAVQALDDSAAERALPTLVCRTCGLKYDNTGTYLQGSRCPSCFPSG
jgi:predicted Zn-ribbon and HTH transcriptional regulator